MNHSPFLVKNLGVWFVASLKMKDHITKPCSRAFYDYDNSWQIRKYVSRESTQVYILATTWLINHSHT